MWLQLGSGLCLKTQNTHYSHIVYQRKNLLIQSISNSINSDLIIYSILGYLYLDQKGNKYNHTFRFTSRRLFTCTAIFSTLPLVLALLIISKVNNQLPL